MIDVARRAELIACGAAEWRDPNSTVRRESRSALRDSPWSQPVIEAALDNVLWDLDDARAVQCAHDGKSADPRPVLVILPGNVIGPTIASAYCAAAAGASVILKSAGVERHLAPIVARQFERLGPPLAGTIDARYWKGGDETIERDVFNDVRRIVVLGSDATVDSVLRRAASADVVSYGSSFSIGFVSDGADFPTAARGAARDICMFDQRGCMSPHTIYVEGEEGRALRFAHALGSALRAAGEELPRARIERDEAALIADAVRRLAVSAVPARTHGLDTIVLGPKKDECPEFVIAVEPCGSPAVVGFGRIVSVKPCTHLPPNLHNGLWDTLGYAGDRTPLLEQAIAEILDQPHAARFCALGEMQRPPFGYRPAIENFA